MLLKNYDANNDDIANFVLFVKNSIVMEHLKWDYVILLQLTNNECHEHRESTVVNGNCAIIY